MMNPTDSATWPIGELGVTGVFLAPALTDLVVVIMAIFMIASVFGNMTKLEAQENNRSF